MFGLPSEELRRLDFLIGDSCGSGTMFPPGKHPINYQGSIFGARESCERYLRLDFFGDLPMLGSESVHSLITYSRKEGCYKMWSFASSQEEPAEFAGEFRDGKLVFLSDPTDMMFGIQRVRVTFEPISEGLLNYSGDLWTMDGYVPFFRGIYQCQAIPSISE